MSTASSSPVDRPPGSWLFRHRWKAALTIAAVEGVIAAVQGTSRFVLVGVALLVVFVYFRWGRATESEVGAELAWIGATSQVLVVLLVVAAFLVGFMVFVAVAALAALALLLLFLERR